MTYTSIKQSKRLMELGLNPDSADLSYSNISRRGLKYTKAFTMSLEPYKKHSRALEDVNKVVDFQKNNCMWEVLPCWSAECLLNLLPSIIKTGDEVRNWYWFNLNKEPYQVTYGNSLGSSDSWHDMISSSQSDELIDAVYSIMKWILEKLNKKEFPFDNELNNELLYGIFGSTSEKRNCLSSRTRNLTENGIIKNIENEFEQDARDASIEYQIAKHPMAIGGAAFSDIAREMNVNRDFVAGARFGMEWYKNKVQSIISQEKED